MSISSTKRMKEFIAENFEDIEEELGNKSDIGEISASELDSILYNNPIAALEKLEDTPPVTLIKSGYYIAAIINYGGDDWIYLSTRPDGAITNCKLMIKKYFGSDWSTLIDELKKGDKITFVIKGSTAYVEGSNLCVSCMDLYVCESPDDVFVYPTIALSEDAPIGKLSMSVLSKYSVSSGKLIDRRMYEEYKASRVSNKNLNGESDGCYIATCIYGTYDCPSLWTLRRFRDDILKSFFIGRLFIKFYYGISPHLVSWFGKKPWFQSFWKIKLDYFVRWLNRKGIKNTEYDDTH